jgi:GNAT superfamily N-acetyltransferase
MCVRVEKQHTGVGSRLMNYLIKELESDGVRTISLLTNRGIPAEAFYKKNGFSEIKRLMFLSRDIK